MGQFDEILNDVLNDIENRKKDLERAYEHKRVVEVQAQAEEATKVIVAMHNSFINQGLTSEQAFELTKIIVANSMKM